MSRPPRLIRYEEALSRQRLPGTFLALAVPTALPVFLVKIIGLPAWSPGAALALNATLVAVAAPIVMSAISGRRRRNVLMASNSRFHEQPLEGCLYCQFHGGTVGGLLNRPEYGGRTCRLTRGTAARRLP